MCAQARERASSRAQAQAKRTEAAAAAAAAEEELEDDCLSPDALMSPQGTFGGIRGVRHVGSADVLEGLALPQSNRPRYRKVCFGREPNICTREWRWR